MWKHIFGVIEIFLKNIYDSCIFCSICQLFQWKAVTVKNQIVQQSYYSHANINASIKTKTNVPDTF